MRKSFHLVLLPALAFLTAIFLPILVKSQYEYISSMNYNNLELSRVGNVQGVGWVSVDNTDYDANHQRFFFMGEATQAGPLGLYTISMVTGATIYNPVSPPGGNDAGAIFGLQYDNATDTLYAIYFTNSNATLLVWLDPATGIPHTIANLTSSQGYYESTFDTRDHIYILSNNGAVTGLNASTGALVYQFSIPNVSNIQYDNLNHVLYGVEYDNSAVYLDSLSPSTGTPHQISALPSGMYYTPIARTIDEQNGKFLFVAANTENATCILNSFYVVDVSSGTLLSESLYPYAQDQFNRAYENFIQYSFDNKRGVLYALNWDPPYPKPAFNIHGTINPLCGDSSGIFIASAPTGSILPFFQWQVNGINAGADTSVFTINSLAPGDSVRCIFWGMQNCSFTFQDTSNSVVASYITASELVNITTPVDTVCQGNNNAFTAHVLIPGTNPIYQWQVNNSDIGAGDSVFSSSTLTNGSVIRCIVSGGPNCTEPKSDTSNIISITVNSGAASLTISSSANAICSGDTVLFIATPLNDGGSPAVQWQINGSSAGTSNDTLISSSLENGDVINCVLLRSPGCSLLIPSSDSIAMVVNPTPLIEFDPDTLVIKPGETTTLNPLVTGNVSSYDWTPADGLNNPVVLNPVASPSLTTVYELSVVGSDGCPAAEKMTVIIYYPLEMPNAFTPNGDGRNDVFRVPALTPQLIESFAVFNRWGEMLYKTTNGSKGWDGTFKGQPQPTGTYVWIIMYEDLLTRQRQVAKGTVMLIR